MPISLAYLIVVLIWSTTPLAIYYSNSDFGFLLSVLLRMSFGAFIVALLLAIRKQKLISSRRDIFVMTLASIGIFPAMPLVYWATQYVPTGLVSLMFSSSPFFVGVLSKLLLGEQIGLRKVTGVVIAFFGLVVIFVDQMSFGSQSIYGILALISSTFFFSLSAVLLKKYNAHSEPLQQAGGSMLLALPGLFLAWFFLDGAVPTSISIQPVAALLYLSVVGSVIGFTTFYYLLKNLTANSVSLISMISPVLAIIWGFLFKGEIVNVVFVLGATMLLAGLAVYSGLVATRFSASN